MADAAKVQGLKLYGLFNELIAKRVIISISVVGAEYDRLTCITGLQQDGDGQFLIIDPPDDFHEAAKKSNEWHLHFNFNGPDKLEYIFSTRGGDIGPQGLRIPFPRHVERLQRRRNFRVATLTGTQLHFKLKKIQGVFDLINVSLGGVYGVLVKHNFKFIRRPVLKQDQTIERISLVFPNHEDQPGKRIRIKKAMVKRVEHDQEGEFYRYAFEFKEMEREERNALTQVIYDLQRWHLQHRK